MVASLLFLLFIPGAVEDLVAGEIEGETLTDRFARHHPWVRMRLGSSVRFALAAKDASTRD